MVYATQGLAEAVERAYHETEKALADLRECAAELERAEKSVLEVLDVSEDAQLSQTVEYPGQEDKVDDNTAASYRGLAKNPLFKKVLLKNRDLNIKNRDLLRTALKDKTKVWRSNEKYAGLLERSLLSSDLSGISGTKTRGCLFLRFCNQRPLYELSDALRTHIEQAQKDLTPIPFTRSPSDCDWSGREARLTDCWYRLLRDLRLPHHLVRNTSNQKLFGAFNEKPDLSIVHVETFKSHLIRKRKGERISEKNISLESIDDEEFSLLGWGPIDVVFELKNQISEDGENLCGPGFQAASQAYHRLCCMRHYPFVVVADSKNMMFFHISGTPFSTEWNTLSTPFWRRSPLVGITEGLDFLRVLLEVLDQDWRREGSLAWRRTNLARNVNLGLEPCISLRRPRAVDALSISAKLDGGASIFVLQGRQMNTVVVKVVCRSGPRGTYAWRNLDRERRRLLSLNKAGIRGVPALKLTKGREQGDQEGLITWNGSDEKRYMAIVLTPFANGGTLKQQRHLLHDRREGGIILCRIMKRIARILCNVHSTLVDDHHYAVHGDLKPSNIVLVKSVMESEDPEALLIDWEHSMLLKEEPHPRKPSCMHKVGDKSPQKFGELEATNVGGESPPEYVSAFTPAFCARCQHDMPITTNSIGPQVDWESLFLTFVFMVDRQKMRWLWSPFNDADASEAEYRDFPTSLMTAKQEMVSAKNKLLMECKDLWKDCEQEKWKLYQWESDSVQKILDLLQTWAAWIVDGEMKEPEKAEALVDMFPTQ